MISRIEQGLPRIYKSALSWSIGLFSPLITNDMAEKEEEEEKAKFDKSRLSSAKRVLAFMKPYRWRYFLGLFFLLITSVVFLVFAQLTGLLVDSTDIVSGGAPEILPTMPGVDTAGIRDAVFGDLNLSTLDIALILGAILIIQSVFSYFRIYLFAWVTEHTLADLRLATYRTLVRLPMEYFNNKPVGEINSRMSGDVTQIQETLTTTTAEFIRQSIIAVGGIGMLFFTQMKLTVVMLAVVPIVALVAVKFGRYIRTLSKEVQDNVATATNVVNESLTGIANVKAFTNEMYEYLRFEHAIENLRKVGIKTGMWRAIFAAFIVLFVFGAIVGIIIYATILVQTDPNFTPGDFFKFVMLAIVIGVSFGGLSELYSSILKALGAVERVFEIIDEDTEPINLNVPAPETEVEGHIVFKNVNFTYPSRPDMQVLKNLSFSMEAGQQVAIVGPSGAGKSTITAMVMRFYSPESGSISIDDKNIEDLQLTELRQHMAIVPQEVLLFGGTLAENIAYGKPEASLEEIKAAAKKANALDFIEGFPEGFETMAGERGVQLSGGQRQRIAIARAVLNDPSILILDEATSSLDSESERLVQDALDKLMKGRTSIVIAHRLSTIKNADKILVLERGELREEGKHEELIQNEDGLYKHLSSLQFQP